MNGSTPYCSICSLPSVSYTHLGKRLAVFDVCRVAGRAAEHDDVKRFSHMRLKRRVDAGCIHSGEIAQVHAFGRVGVHGAHEVLVDFLSLIHIYAGALHGFRIEHMHVVALNQL